MNILQSIGIIAGSVGVIVLMFFIFKWINSRKIKSLKKTVDSLVDQNTALEKRNKGLVEKVEQMNRERAAAGNHMNRLVRTREETKTLQSKIDIAHTEDEIMEILSYIDEDNNMVVRG